MNATLIEIELRGGFNRQQPATTRHGHAVRSFTLRRPGRIGSFLLTADATQPRLHWRSTRR